MYRLVLECAGEAFRPPSELKASELKNMQIWTEDQGIDLGEVRYLSDQMASGWIDYAQSPIFLCIDPVRPELDLVVSGNHRVKAAEQVSAEIIASCRIPKRKFHIRDIK